MKADPRRGVKWASIFAFSLYLLVGEAAFALQPPSRQEIERYLSDGSLSQRMENAKALGNHRISSRLLERFRYKLNRLRLEQEGFTPRKIDEILAPPPAWRGMPTRGTVKILALLIEFSDYPHQSQNSKESIESKLFGDGTGVPPYESLRNYYRRSSYNQLEIQGNVLGWYNTGSPRSSVPQTTAGRENLIKQALNYYNGLGHDFTQYDNDGDGAIDYLVVIWTGPDNGWANFWWGYMTTFTDSSYRLDGKRLDTYSWQWEARPYPGTFAPLVVIHETGHALGLPDYYDYNASIGPRGGVGGLDMMDANKGDHNCFSKFLLDWISPTAYRSGSSTITLNASGTSQDAVVIMPGAVAGNAFGEFFMVQNRYRVGNDAGQYPADGLLIWHVDSTLNYFGTDFVYDNSYTSHKLLRLMEADGLEEIEAGRSANAGDYYVAGKILSSLSTPNSNRYDGTSTWMTVHGISTPGSSMSFKVSFGPPDINVRKDATSIPTGTGSFDFGPVTLGANLSVTFVVENLGGSPLSLTATPRVQVSGTHASDFVVTTQASTPLLPGESTTFVIRFAPSATGLRTATASIASDDTDENPYRFSLVGLGVTSAPPPAPVLVSPSNGATGVSTSATLSWGASSGASSYRVQVSTSSTFGTTVLDQSGITGTSQVVSGLLNDTVYYWRVNASNAGGTSSWSAVWSFRTNAPPQAFDDSFSTGESMLLTVPAPGVLANDTDREGHSLITVLVSSPFYGELTLNPDGSFVYVPGEGFSGVDRFTYRAYDGISFSNGATVTIVVNPRNQVPVAADDYYVVLEDSLLAVAAPGVLGNDNDGDGDLLTPILLESPKHGILVFEADGSFTYAPDPDFYGTDGFSYKVSDGLVESNVAMVTIAVTAVNDGPLAQNDFYWTNEDTALEVSAPGILGNDVDREGDPLTVNLVSGPLYGSLTLNSDGSFTYVPDPDFYGTDSFSYKVSDGLVESNVAMATIAVMAVNDRPVAQNDSYWTNEDTALEVPAPGVLGNDLDPESDTLRAILVSGPLYGSLSLHSDGSFTYIPNEDFFGTDSFSYKVSDGSSESNVGMVTITVAGVDDPPVAYDQSVVTDEDIPKMITLTAEDVDGEPLSFTILSPPAFGTLIGTPPDLTYVPDPDFYGLDQFSFVVTDGNLDSNVAIVTVIVLPVNDPPLSLADSYTVQEDNSLNVPAPGVLANDADKEADPLTAILVSGPSHGSLNLDPDGSFTYIPDPDFSGLDTFWYKASDGTVESDPVPVTITVWPVNDPPVAHDQSVTTRRKKSAEIVLSATDVDGDPIRYTILDPPSHGVLSGEPPNLVYTPEADFVGIDAFRFKANDGTLDSNVAVVSITVKGPPRPPALISPEHKATRVSTNLTLSWAESPGATSYDVQLSTSETFATVLFEADGITGTSQAVYGLPKGIHHYWRVRASNEEGDSEWSDTWNFKTMGAPMMVVRREGVPVPNHDGMVDFGEVNRHSSRSVWLTIENVGEEVLNLIGTPLIRMEGSHVSDFSMTWEPSSSILPGGSTAFQIRFAPGEKGVRSANLVIESDDEERNPYQITVTGTGMVESFPFTDDFASEKGWVSDGSEGWQRRSASLHDEGYPVPELDHSHTDDNHILGIAIGLQSTDPHTVRSIISPPIDCSEERQVFLKFWRYLRVTHGGRAEISISTNGEEWTPIWVSGDPLQGQGTIGVGDSAWTKVVYDISALAASNDAVLVRFTLESPANPEEPSVWFIDDLEVTSGYSISGYIQQKNGTPVADVRVCFKNRSGMNVRPCVETDAFGFYIQYGFEPYDAVAKNTIEVTPSHPQFGFFPLRRSVKIEDQDVVKNFQATPRTRLRVFSR